MQERKVDLPEHKASIEKFEQCATNMIQMFTDTLQTNHDLRESVLQEFSATMDSKDKVIQSYPADRHWRFRTAAAGNCAYERWKTG